MELLFAINREGTSIHELLGEYSIFVLVVNIDLTNEFSYLLALLEFNSRCIGERIRGSITIVFLVFEFFLRYSDLFLNFLC